MRCALGVQITYPVRLPVGTTAQSYLEVIRFAASNRLCVDLDYRSEADPHARTRRIEPYSLRRSQDGNISLHAWDVDRNARRSYRLDRITNVRTTNKTFNPRYAIELTSAGPVAIPPTQSATGVGGLGFAH